MLGEYYRILIGFWEVCGSSGSHRCSRTVNTGNIIVGGKKAQGENSSLIDYAWQVRFSTE